MKSYRLGSLLLCILALTLASCDKATPKNAPAPSIPEVKVVKAHGESLRQNRHKPAFYLLFCGIRWFFPH